MNAEDLHTTVIRVLSVRYEPLTLDVSRAVADTISIVDALIRSDERDQITRSDFAAASSSLLGQREAAAQLHRAIADQHRLERNGRCCRGNDDLHNALVTLDAEVTRVLGQR